MLSNYIPKRFAPTLIKHVVAVSLFIPYFYSKSFNYFYQDYILANFFAILAMICIFTSWKLDLRKNGILLAGMGILLIAYNVCATYMNYNYHHWYGEQINTTISFLFFMVLLMVKDPHALIDSNMIRSIIHMMVITNVLAIGYRLITEQNRILFMNNLVRRDKYVDGMAPQFSWLYIHKSQYALILVLCIAFCVVYRKMFRNMLTYLLSLGVLIFALYLSDSYTSMGAAALIFVGQFLDYLRKAEWWKKLVAGVAMGVPGIIGCLKLYEMIGEKRDLLTLGTRTLIWKGSWETIINNPNGVINFVMGRDRFPYYAYDNGWFARAYNCHNIILNHMFRFSFLVGGILLLLFILLFLLVIKRTPSFLTLTILIALIVPLGMDYSLTCAETTFVLTILYCAYFRTAKL